MKFSTQTSEVCNRSSSILTIRSMIKNYLKLQTTRETDSFRLTRAENISFGISGLGFISNPCEKGGKPAFEVPLDQKRKPIALDSRIRI